MHYFKDKIYIMSFRYDDETKQQLKKMRLYYGFKNNTETIKYCINTAFKLAQCVIDMGGDYEDEKTI